MEARNIHLRPLCFWMNNSVTQSQKDKNVSRREDGLCVGLWFSVFPVLTTEILVILQGL